MYINNWAAAWDFQQFEILTNVDSDEPLHPSFNLRNSKWCSVSSLTIIEYSSDQQRLWSDCAYAQADLRLCWSHIPYCWKSHALAQFIHVPCYVYLCTVTPAVRVVRTQIVHLLRGYIFQKLILAWRFSCINKNCFFCQGEGYLWQHCCWDCCMKNLYISLRSRNAPTYSF